MGNMAEKDINITFDTLFELLGREKKREDLQPLPESFLNDVLSYLREKEAILKKPDDDNLFSTEEKEKTRSQLDNVRKIIKELYEKRERKIVEMALFKSRTNSNIINTTNLLKEEKMLFEAVVEEMTRYRKGVLLKLLSLQETKIELPQTFSQAALSQAKNISENLSAGATHTSHESSQLSSTASHQVSSSSNSETAASAAFGNASSGHDNKPVRFVSFVPKFVGKELEVYGPFEPEDTANLPKQIVDILVRKGKAIEIKAVN